MPNRAMKRLSRIIRMRDLLRRCRKKHTTPGSAVPGRARRRRRWRRRPARRPRRRSRAATSCAPAARREATRRCATTAWRTGAAAAACCLVGTAMAPVMGLSHICAHGLVCIAWCAHTPNCLFWRGRSCATRAFPSACSKVKGHELEMQEVQKSAAAASAPGITRPHCSLVSLA